MLLQSLGLHVIGLKPSNRNHCSVVDSFDASSLDNAIESLERVADRELVLRSWFVPVALGQFFNEVVKRPCLPR